ncbi:MAG TPA: hypothetical protein VHL50_09700 [Pyrinomonadaceae bacterium]|nr:hypothetical protein [Pyrinomonadaceae bacterium]
MDETPDIDKLLKNTDRSVRQMSEMLKLVIESRDKDLKLLSEIEAEIEDLKRQQESLTSYYPEDQ